MSCKKVVFGLFTLFLSLIGFTYGTDFVFESPVYYYDKTSINFHGIKNITNGYGSISNFGSVSFDLVGLNILVDPYFGNLSYEYTGLDGSFVLDDICFYCGMYSMDSIIMSINGSNFTFTPDNNYHCCLDSLDLLLTGSNITVSQVSSASDYFNYVRFSDFGYNISDFYFILGSGVALDFTNTSDGGEDLWKVPYYLKFHNVENVVVPEFTVNYNNTSVVYTGSTDIYLEGSTFSKNGNTFTAYNSYTGSTLNYFDNNGQSHSLFYNKISLYLNGLYNYLNNLFSPVCP